MNKPKIGVAAALEAWSEVIALMEAGVSAEGINLLEEALNTNQEGWEAALVAQMTPDEVDRLEALCSNYACGSPSPADVRRIGLEVLRG